MRFYSSSKCETVYSTIENAAPKWLIIIKHTNVCKLISHFFLSTFRNNNSSCSTTVREKQKKKRSVLSRFSSTPSSCCEHFAISLDCVVGRSDYESAQDHWPDFFFNTEHRMRERSLVDDDDDVNPIELVVTSSCNTAKGKN